jgi:radical SAM superfamily enzyme YgiQ (UPF0313 family)
MNVLLVAPTGPETFWSMGRILPFLGAKAVIPPLGLLTIAALLPEEWSLKLVDLNTTASLDQDLLEWADMLFISAMIIQSDSTEEVLVRAKEAGVTVVAGGPLFMSYGNPEMMDFLDAKGVDHLFLSEAEELVDQFVLDLKNGQAQKIYKAERFPDVQASPIPRYDLVKAKDYYCLGLQFSRGCPFNCEFCDVVFLNGRTPRFKTVEQCLSELDAMFDLGWNGAVMFVDDNFIGNKKQAKKLLHAIISWQKDHGRPFYFLTQASINLADDPELGSLMTAANFAEVFIGIETPSSSALKECGKNQNQNRDLVQAVHTIQGYGLDVMAGFIVGFDSDTLEIFDMQRDFIEQAAIPMALVSLLTAVPGTALWERLKQEKRLLSFPSGNNAFDYKSLNFEPKMDRDVLLNGYRDLLAELYSPAASYGRVSKLFKHYSIPKNVLGRKPSFREIVSFFKMNWSLGICQSSRLGYWRLVIPALLRYPRYIPQVMTLAAMVHHCQKLTSSFLTEGKPSS